MPKSIKLLDFFTNIAQFFVMTLEEIDQLYTEEAKQIGHRVYLIKQLEKEIKAFVKKCNGLAQQKARLEEAKFAADQAKEEDVSKL
jgi:hypothetical protein